MDEEGRFPGKNGRKNERGCDHQMRIFGLMAGARPRACRRVILSAAAVMLAMLLLASPVMKPGASAASGTDEFTPGNYVFFGTYPQSEFGDDKTPIEWLVLDREGDKALLLSWYGLDTQPYNEDSSDITWEACALRKWLNSDFMNRAFTAEEQAAILKTEVDNTRSQGYSEWDANGGKNTEDKIFLLSYAEVSRYFGVVYGRSGNTASRVSPTGYAKKQGANAYPAYKTIEAEDAGWWWLRSPGYHQGSAARVGADGSLGGFDVYESKGCVRPALWVDLGSGIF